MKTKYLKPEAKIITSVSDVLCVSCDNFVKYDGLWDGGM